MYVEKSGSLVEVLLKLRSVSGESSVSSSSARYAENTVNRCLLAKVLLQYRLQPTYRCVLVRPIDSLSSVPTRTDAGPELAIGCPLGGLSSLR